MAVISLLTDFGLQDEYAGVMRGVILGIAPSATVVDLCHGIPPGDRRRAAYLLAWAHRYFPPRTIHVAVVDPGVGTRRRLLCAQAHGQMFLAPDNGLLTLVLQRAARPVVYEVRARRYWRPEVSATFHGRDIVAPVAAHLARGVRPSRLGPRTTRWIRLALPAVRWPRRTTRGRQGRGGVGAVVDVDRFGNLVTNIEAAALADSGRWTVRIHGRTIRGIVRTYREVPHGALAAMVGSRGLLEIAVCEGNAARRLKAAVGDRVALAPA